MKIVVVGNCQVRPVVTILSELCSKNTQFEYVVAHLSSSATEICDLQYLSEADLIFTQPIDDAYSAGHLSTSRLKKSYADKVITWPNIFYSGQCPDLMTVTNSNGSVVKGPLETYQLAGVLSAWKQRQSVREAVTHLNNNLPQNEATLTLGNTTSMQALIQRETSTDVKITDFIESQFSLQQLFFTFNHPTLTVLIELCERMLNHCDVDIRKRVVAQFWEEPLGRLTYPMTTPIAEFLGVKFPFTNACRGVSLDITNETVNLGQTKLYSFEEFIAESFRAYDAQLTKDSILRCTPQYLSSYLTQPDQNVAA